MTLPLLDPSGDNPARRIQAHSASSLGLLLPSKHEALSLMSACETAVSEWREHDIWSSRSGLWPPPLFFFFS